MLNHAARLKAALEAARGQPCEVRIVSRPPRPVIVEVDPPLPADAAAIAAFNWGEAAHLAWLEDQQPERKGLRQAAAQALADNEAHIADANVTNAEAIAASKRHARQINFIIKRLIQID